MLIDMYDHLDLLSGRDKEGGRKSAFWVMRGNEKEREGRDSLVLLLISCFLSLSPASYAFLIFCQRNDSKN